MRMNAAKALDIASEAEMAEVPWSDAKLTDAEAAMVEAAENATLKAASEAYTQVATAPVKAQIDIADLTGTWLTLAEQTAKAKAELIAAINAENKAQKAKLDIKAAITARKAKEWALAKAEAKLLAVRREEGKARKLRWHKYEEFGFA